jgi:hypothetical protein
MSQLRCHRCRASPSQLMMKLSHALQNRCARTVGLICLMAVVVLARLARADEVTFNDLGDTVSTTVTSSSSGSSVTIDLCGIFSVPFHGTAVSVEGCKATIAGPADSDSFKAPLLTLIGGDNGKISDAIIVTPDVLDDNKLHVIFASDLEIPGTPGIGVACSTIPGDCQVTETGGVQPGVTITWGNHATDIVSFKSDTDSIVPEPSSLILMGGGLLVVGYLKRRLT